MIPISTLDFKALTAEEVCEGDFHWISWNACAFCADSRKNVYTLYHIISKLPLSSSFYLILSACVRVSVWIFVNVSMYRECWRHYAWYEFEYWWCYSEDADVGERWTVCVCVFARASTFGSRRIESFRAISLIRLYGSMRICMFAFECLCMCSRSKAFSV